MAKEQKTAGELAAMIRERIREPALRVDVHPDETSNWAPVVDASPADAHALQVRADQAAGELRAPYDLV
jgi:hypothetical protein